MSKATVLILLLVVYSSLAYRVTLKHIETEKRARLFLDDQRTIISVHGKGLNDRRNLLYLVKPLEGCDSWTSATPSLLTTRGDSGELVTGALALDFTKSWVLCFRPNSDPSERSIALKTLPAYLYHQHMLPVGTLFVIFFLALSKALKSHSGSLAIAIAAGALVFLAVWMDERLKPVCTLGTLALALVAVAAARRYPFLAANVGLLAASLLWLAHLLTGCLAGADSIAADLWAHSVKGATFFAHWLLVPVGLYYFLAAWETKLPCKIELRAVVSSAVLLLEANGLWQVVAGLTSALLVAVPSLALLLQQDDLKKGLRISELPRLVKWLLGTSSVGDDDDDEGVSSTARAA
eukprot:RCo019227